MADWQPIETAKHEVVVDLWCELRAIDDKGQAYTKAALRWPNCKYETMGDGNKSWVSRHLDDNRGSGTIVTHLSETGLRWIPTHWMPLPTAPGAAK